jgi:hypothetical protein
MNTNKITFKYLCKHCNNLMVVKHKKCPRCLTSDKIESIAPVKSVLKRSKHNSIITIVDGIKFRSKLEAKVYCDLKILKLAGKVSDFTLQPAFPIIINGIKCFKYYADFRVLYANKPAEYWDAKGMKTAMYKLKKKCVEAQYGIKIIEVTA